MALPAVGELARQTPLSRDRYVDFLRAASIVVVVLGHWLIALLAWDHGVIRSTSAIGRSPALWLATWALQVMPVFFFVGGYANYVALDTARHRGEPTHAVIRRRVRRLLLPAIAFLTVWTVVLVGLHLAGVGAPTGPRLPGGIVLLRGVRPPGQTIPFGPLWFLAAYLVVVATSPVTVAAHRRWRWWVPALMAVGAVICDVVGFVGGVGRVRYLNIVFVLFLPHQLGHFLADGTIRRWSWRPPAIMAGGGLAGLVLLTNPWLFRLAGDARFDWFPGIGYYPRSLLGTDVEQISNAYPPTLCFLLGGIWLLGVALLARPALERWLRRPRPWMATVAVNLRIMTLFLWHMTAYLLAILLLWPLGFGQQPEPTARWWAERPLWVVVPGVILLLLVRVFGRFEARGHARPTARVG